MTSTKQIVANRQNAIKSTGPKTLEGKMRAANNAMKHGLLSRSVLLEDENEDDLVEFGKRLRASLKPVGELENFLADRIITAAWRLRRLLRVEVGVFQEERLNIFREDVGIGRAFIEDGKGADAFSKLGRYETTIERGLYRALHELHRLQAERAGS